MIEAAAQDPERQPAHRHGARVGLGVDAAGEPRDDHRPRGREFGGEAARECPAAAAGGPGADNTDGRGVLLLQARAPTEQIKDWRRIADFLEERRIVGIAERHDLDAAARKRVAQHRRLVESLAGREPQPLRFAQQVGKGMRVAKDIAQAGGAHAGGARGRRIENAQGQEQQALGVVPFFHSFTIVFPFEQEPMGELAEDSIAPVGDTMGPRGAGKRASFSRNAAGIALAFPKRRFNIESPRKMRAMGLGFVALSALAWPLSANARTNNSKAEVQFGMEAARRGLWEEARFRFAKAVDAEPDNASALNNLAIALEQQGDFAQAREAYEKALKLNPGSAYIQQNFDLFKEADEKRNRKAKKKP
jgi:tetratricopeptide (TPR) repeat protein